MSAAEHRAYRASLRRGMVLDEGERLMPFYSWDFALCDCPPSTLLAGVPVLAAVVRGRLNPGPSASASARCLTCGVRWLVPKQRRVDRVPIGSLR